MLRTGANRRDAASNPPGVCRDHIESRDLSARPPSKRLGVLAASLAAFLLIASSCGSDPDNTAAEDKLQSEASAPDNGNDDGLEVIELTFDEDAPVDVAQAYDQSDFVVVASIRDVEDGARFYGESEEDNITVVYEDILLNIDVAEVLKGDVEKTMAVRWPGYVGTGRSSAERTGVLRVEGVTLNSDRKNGTYLMFLRNYGPPFGLSFIALSSAVIELGPQQRATGQVSSIFERYRGSKLDDILSEAVIER